MSSIRDITVAVDLEGTLVSRSFYLTKVESYLDEEGITVHELDRLRRALANELLMALSTFRKRSLVWTGCSPKRAKGIIARAGLIVPPTMEVITRDRYLEALGRSRVVTDAEEAIRTDGRYRDSLIDKVRRGGVKIPCVLGVDFLLDDFGDMDGEVCALLEAADLSYAGESRKPIEVKSFHLATMERLREHHLERGLLSAVEELQRRAVSR